MRRTNIENWEIFPCAPFVPIHDRSVETGKKLDGILDPIPAQVPGSVYEDLLRAGIIEDPQYEMNSLNCEWVSNRWWVYRTKFRYKSSGNGYSTVLRFEGIDYIARIYFNQQFLARHEGIGSPIELDVTRLLQSENELIVIIENVSDEMGQIGLTSETKTVKPRFSYKWDFGTRLVNVGIYQPVTVIERKNVRIREWKFDYELDADLAKVKLGLVLDSKKKTPVIIEVSLGEKTLRRKTILKNGRQTRTVFFSLAHPKLWFCNGAGEPNSYPLQIVVWEGDERSDEISQTVGFKDLQITANENASPNALPYTVVLNGKKVYVKGVNVVPVDLCYGDHHDDRMLRLLDLAKQAGVNLVRVWGGGLIANDSFYRGCTERGLMVWQEFTQTSSGIENIPSEKREFLQRFRRTSTEAVKRCRNYVSLALWSGGNELSDSARKPLTFANRNLAMLKKIVERYDPGRYMYPTSGTGPNYFLDPKDKGNNHDVHGFWKCDCLEDHFRFFNESDSLFHSEFGVDAVTNRNILEGIFSPENRVVTDATRNVVWRHHGEYWATLDRDESVFGRIETLDEYIAISQFLQYEGVRYGIESNRRRAYQNSGSIVWQLNEPYQNASCTNLVAYDNQPKMGYYALKIAFQKNLGSAQYDRLIFGRNENVKLRIFVTSDDEGENRRSLDVIFTNSMAQLLERETVTATVGNGRSVFVKEYEFPMPQKGNLIVSLFGEKGDINRMIFFARESDGRIDRKNALADIGYLNRLIRK